MDPVYLDNNATTRPAPEVADAMARVNDELWGNPSSVHRFGQRVRQAVELARQQIASLIGASSREITFTSGGTEADNLALLGTRPDVLVTTAIEHSAIRATAQRLEAEGAAVVHLPIDRAGRVALGDLAKALDDIDLESRRVLVSIQWVNNETGVIQDIAGLSEVVAAARAATSKRSALLFHSDATQAVGKMPVDVGPAGLDLLTLAGHKFHGPKGIGALWVNRGVKLRPTQLGGSQERERRGGTENTPGIVGLGVAAELAQTFLTDTDRIEHLTGLRDRFETELRNAAPDLVINGTDEHCELAPRLWNTSNVGFPGLEAEAILLGLSERGVCASAGAACSSGSLEPSPVLLAMGVPEPVAHGSVRFSLGRYTTDADVDTALAVVPQVIARLGKTLPI